MKIALTSLLAVLVAPRACLTFQGDGTDGITTATQERFYGHAWDDNIISNNRQDNGEPALSFYLLDVMATSTPTQSGSPPLFASLVTSDGNNGLGAGWFDNYLSYQTLGNNVAVEWVLRDHSAPNLRSVQFFRQRATSLAGRTPQQKTICIDYDDVTKHYTNFHLVRDLLDLSSMQPWQRLVVTVGWDTLVEQEIVDHVSRDFQGSIGLQPTVQLRNTPNLACGPGSSTLSVARFSQTAGDAAPFFELGSTPGYNGNVDFGNLSTQQISSIYSYYSTFNRSSYWTNRSTVEPPILHAEILGTILGNVISHEYGHQLGLVATQLSGGPGAHVDVSGVAASVRNVPREIMGPEAGIDFDEHAEHRSWTSCVYPDKHDCYSSVTPPVVWNQLNASYLSLLP
jgi:hypothetical protein